MSATSIRFSHGVASGDPYADSVILWTRISPGDGVIGPQTVQWEIATSADFAAGSIKGSGSFSTSAARDWTVKLEAAGLSADTSYFYRFRAGDGVSPVGQTKTLPVNSDPVRLAIFSCANFPAAQQFEAYARAAAINNANPYDAWLQVGDYIYEYGPGGYGSAEDAAGSRGFSPNREILSLDDYRQRYAQYHTDAGLQALRAAAPLIAIWDDHETANDSWKGGAENHQSTTEGDWIARRDAALKAYYEWIPIREPGQRQPSDGATASSPLSQGYRSFSFGDVLALHMLETRLTARDQQLKYPDAAAVQARIGAILADPAQLASYATKAGMAPPSSAATIPAFATALAPLVTQELVLATVQQAWGDPSRKMIGATQMAWLQQQMASSSAAWQVLGQQVLMQSMAVPAELLLNAGNPALLDKYAAPLQKLATGTAFASLSPAEQALFAESGKIPYNLDAWDGYGAEREVILQTALSLDKRLISLAGDTHNAWAGVLDTMSAGSKPAGTMAGVEFATPGVTSPGLEQYLLGADAYIRTKYPAVDGLDGLFGGYVNGLKYAELSRRGFLDLTVSKEQAVGSFQFLNGSDPLNGKSLWSSETVVSSASYALTSAAEALPLITWQPDWRELDLIFGLAVDSAGLPTVFDPAAYASVPRDGVQLADVRVQGSSRADRVFVGVGSRVDTSDGSDELDNIDSLGDNLLVGGSGSDRFFLTAVNDLIIGGQLFASVPSLKLSNYTALVDHVRDDYLIDTSGATSIAPLQILDYEPGIDQLLIDGVAPIGDWGAIRQQLGSLNVNINSAPQLEPTPITIKIFPGEKQALDLNPFVNDADADGLSLLKLSGPEWFSVAGTTLTVAAPTTLDANSLANAQLVLGFSDGRAVSDFRPVLMLIDKPLYTPGPNTTNGINLGSTSAGYALKNGDGIPIPVSYSGGKASANNPGNGWSALAAAPTSSGYAFFWRNSASKHVARWNLNSSGVYESGYYLSSSLTGDDSSESLLLKEEAFLDLDLNGDGFIPLSPLRLKSTPSPDNVYSPILGRTSSGYALLPGFGVRPIQLTYPGGNASPSNPGNGWTAVAATPADPDFPSLYWRNSITQEVARWKLNPSGAYQSGSILSAEQLFSEEADLNLDLNGDGSIAVRLGSTSEAYELLRSGLPPLQVVFSGGVASASNPGTGWKASAVVASNRIETGGFSLYWTNSNSNQTARWDLNASGLYADGVLLSTDQLVEVEAKLKRDLNGDGFIAGPSTIQGLNLGSTSQGYALQTGSEAPVHVSWTSGNASVDNPGNGWVATVALPTASGSDLYWKNEATGQQARWSLNASGAYQSGTFLSNDEIYGEEISLSTDLNNDSIIGASYWTIENQGNAALLRRNDREAFVETGGKLSRVTSPFNLKTGNDLTPWQMLAAEKIDEQNQILWRNNAENFLHLWNLDAAWNWQSSYGAINPFSPESLNLETSFKVDLNGDGGLG